MATSVDSAAETAVDGVDARSNVNEATAQSEAAELKDATDGQKVEDAASIVKQSRKRTKSGCLTCRRRRIKCGEERPICHNCVKSKRTCEGYNQRVIFKDPVNGFRPGPTEPSLGIPIDLNRFHHLSPTGLSSQAGAGPSSSYTSQVQLPNIAPRPTNTYAYSAEGTLRTPPTLEGDVQNGWVRGGPTIGPRSIPNDLAEYQRQYRTASVTQIDTEQPTHENQQPLLPVSGSGQRILLEASDAYRNPGGDQYGLTTSPQAAFQANGQPYTSPPLTHDSSPDQLTFPTQNHRPHNSTAQPDLALPWGHYARISPTAAFQSSWDTSHENVPLKTTSKASFLSTTPQTLRTLAPGVIPEPQAGSYSPEEDDEDPYDIATDDEMDTEYSEANSSNAMGALPPVGSNLVEASRGHQVDHVPPATAAEVRETPSLSDSQPSKTLPRRMSPKTRQLFCHFIAVTGPSISIFERHHPNNPSLLSSGTGDVPQPSLWTYTIPMMALTSPPLMHAILALASLHIAKLHGDSMVPSMKHYHKALTGVAKSVSDPSRRGKVVTLAATGLLGFWEVMAAEHNKWNSHVLGARQLLVETDFVALSKRVRRTQAASASAAAGKDYSDMMYRQHGGFRGTAVSELELEHRKTDALVNLLMGRERATQSESPAGLGVQDPSSASAPLTPEQMKDDEIRTDLFWWYLKQDLYQGILSNNPLMLSYDHWNDCPPRSAIGKVDEPYGTFDHLILLLGRVSRFTSRDVKRKKKVVEANGGQWRPSPGMNLGTPRGPISPQGQPRGAGFSPSTGSSHSATGPSGPMMFGMVPPRERGQMPEAFATDERQSPPSSVGGDLDLEAATVEAEDEWREIKNALQVFEDSLGHGWQPVSPERIQPLSTPFGPATHYQSGCIANIWATYYMAQIIHERSHPDMPPMAMMAAGIAARNTGFQATEIARITAGLLPANINRPLDSNLRGALIESSMPLFFAGVQYADPAQRGWTVRKLQDIARLSGWETSLAIASGCESAWEKAGESGRTAPYTRTLNPWAKDDRIAGRKPNYASMAPDDSNDRRLVEVDPKARVHWAVGLLGFEEDMDKLHLDFDDESLGSRQSPL